MTSMAIAGKPHAVFVPFPLQSHIKALLKLAKLLHHRGLEIHLDVKKEQAGKLVREIMEGENGKMMKGKAMQWKRLTEEATTPNGSSSINLDNLVNQVLSS